MHLQRARWCFAPIKRVHYIFLVFLITKFVIKIIPSGRWLWTKSRVTSWPPGRLLRSLICILTPIYNNNIRTISVAGPIIIIISIRLYRAVTFCISSTLDNDFSVTTSGTRVIQFLLDYRGENIILKIF